MVTASDQNNLMLAKQDIVCLTKLCQSVVDVILARGRMKHGVLRYAESKAQADHPASRIHHTDVMQRVRFACTLQMSTAVYDLDAFTDMHALQQAFNAGTLLRNHIT